MTYAGHWPMCFVFGCSRQTPLAGDGGVWRKPGVTQRGKALHSASISCICGKEICYEIGAGKVREPCPFLSTELFRRFRYLYLRWHYYFVLSADIIAVLAGDIRPGGLSELRPPRNSKAIYFQKRSFTRLKGTEMDKKYIMHHSKIRSCMRNFSFSSEQPAALSTACSLDLYLFRSPWQERRGKKMAKKKKQQKQIRNYGWHERLFLFSGVVKMAFHKCSYKYREIHLSMWFDKHIFKSWSKKKNVPGKTP